MWWNDGGFCIGDTSVAPALTKSLQHYVCLLFSVLILALSQVRMHFYRWFCAISSFFMFDISLVTRRSDSLSGTSGRSSKFGEIALNYHCIDDIDLVVNWMLNIEKLVKICLASCLLAPPGVGCCFLLMLEYNSSSYLIKGWFPLINYYLNLTRKQKFTIIMDFCWIKLSQNADI